MFYFLSGFSITYQAHVSHDYYIDNLFILPIFLPGVWALQIFSAPRLAVPKTARKTVFPSYVARYSSSCKVFYLSTEISCPKVPRGHEKLTTLTSNRNCFEKSLKVDEKCEFACSSKYQLTGAKVLTCMKDKGAVGRWEAATGSKTPNCSGRALNIC